jgi:hypothetical protein
MLMKYYRLKADDGDINSERNNQSNFEATDIEHKNGTNHPLTKTPAIQRLPKSIHLDGMQAADIFFVPQLASKKLTISNKLKAILEKYTNPAIHFVPVNIHHSLGTLSYWFLVPGKADYNILNFDKTIMSVIGANGRKITRYTARSSGEMQSIIESLKLPQRLRIDRPSFKDESNSHLIILPNVDEGTAYYISEQLKEEIEYAQCSGARFQAISL